MVRFETAKLTEKAARDAVPLFTRILGRPERHHRDTLRDEVIEALAAVDVIEDEQNLVGEMTGDAEFRRITESEDDYQEMEKPLPYDTDIDPDAMAPEEVKRREAIHVERQTFWHVRRGTILGVGDRIREALDPKYHQKLKKQVFGYKNVAIIDYFDHLDEKWCRLDAIAIKKLKKDYFKGWKYAEEEETVDAFKKRLDENQAIQEENGVHISDEDKYQHFVEEMIESNLFDEKDFRQFDNEFRDAADWDDTTAFFEAVMDSMDSYERNCGGTSKQAKFESAAAINEMKMEALAELRAEQESFRQQQEEQGSALLDYLKSQETSGDAIQAVTQAKNDAERAAAEMKAQLAALMKEVAALKAQAATPITNPRTITPPPPTYPATTGHALNTAGVACPTRITKRGPTQFVTKQHCSHCAKTDYHLPQDCFARPENAHKKAELAEYYRKNPRKRKRGTDNATGEGGGANK